MSTSSWRDYILQEFTPGISKLTIVADPDELLLEEKILAEIRQRGFELLTFEDPVAFRYAYESRFRSHWDRGENTELVVILRTRTEELNSLPFDLLTSGRKLSFNIGDIFPNLSYPVLICLDHSYYDELYQAEILFEHGQLGDNATKDFILKNIFKIDPMVITEDYDLFGMLIRLHYKAIRLPDILADRLIQILRNNKKFDDWPLELIVKDREACFTFIQERWAIFIEAYSGKKTKDVREGEEPCRSLIEGRAYLPFDHQDIRIYIDNLFSEGLLHPITIENAQEFYNSWVSIGIKIDPIGDRLRRLNALLSNINETLPTESARYNDWFIFSRKWAEAIAILCEQQNSPEIEAEFDTLKNKIDGAFLLWIKKNYSALPSLPPVPPVMVHHIPTFLARIIEEGIRPRVAMVVLDGLSLDQWIVIKRVLEEERPDLCFREQVAFSWVPSITSVSRQALFSGLVPFCFSSSIWNLNKEQSMWKQFWTGQGLSSDQVVYQKAVEDQDLSEIEEVISYPKVKVAGLVITKIDKIMHGMQLGTRGMHNQVRQWASQPFFKDLIDLLLKRNFLTIITSDHGNIQSRGMGTLGEGDLPELSGDRVRIYSDPVLYKGAQKKCPRGIAWPAVGLPEDYYVLLAPGRESFARQGECKISHGSISLEELIVPLISIEKKNGRTHHAS